MYKQQSRAQNPVSTNGKNSPRVFSHPFTLIPFVSYKKKYHFLGIWRKISETSSYGFFEISTARKTEYVICFYFSVDEINKICLPPVHEIQSSRK